MATGNVKSQDTTGFRFNPYGAEKTARRLYEKATGTGPNAEAHKPSTTSASDTSWMQNIFTQPGQSRGRTAPSAPAVAPVQTPELDAAVGNTPGTGTMSTDYLSVTGQDFGQATDKAPPAAQTPSLAAWLKNRFAQGVAENRLGQDGAAAEMAGQSEEPAYTGDPEDVARQEWARYGVDNARDYNAAVDYEQRYVGRRSAQSAMDSVRNSANDVGYRAQAGAGRAAAEDAYWADVMTGTVPAEDYGKYQEIEQANTVTEFKDASHLGEAYAQKTAELFPEVTAEMKQLGDLASGITGMAPQIVMGAASLALGNAAPALSALLKVSGSAALFSSASGGAAKDALLNGANPEDALRYGTVVGMVELATEKIANGLGLFGKAAGLGGVTDDLVEGIIKKYVNDTAAQKAFLYVAGMLGEGFEEWVAEYADYFANKKMPGIGYDTRTIQEVGADARYSFAIGSLISAVMQTSNVLQGRRNVTAEDAKAELDNAVRAQEAATGEVTGQETQTQTAAETPPRAPAQTVESILSGPVNRSAANRIINDPALKAAYEAVTGTTLTGPKGDQARAVMAMSAQTAQTEQVAATTTEAPTTALTPSQQEFFTALNNALNPESAQPPVTAQEAPGEAFAPGNEVTAPTAPNAPTQVLNPGTGETSAADDVQKQPPQVRLKENGLSGPVVESQTHSTDPLYTAQERTTSGLRPEDITHTQHSDADVDAAAERRYNADYDGEKADLFNPSAEWDDVDTVLAHRILAAEVEQAQKTGDYSEVVRLQKSWSEHGTPQAQAFRQRGRFANTPEEIIADAAETLYGGDTELRKLRPKQKAGIMDTVVDMAHQYNAVPAGDTGSLIDLIKRLNVIRKTTGLFSKNTSKAMSQALEHMAKAEGGEAFLRDVAATQIRSIAGDYAKPSVINALKDFRVMNMLSKVASVLRNLTANNVLDPLETLSTDIVVPLDMLLSKITGTRSISYDQSWFSKAKRRGSLDGFIKSFIQEGLDANVDNVKGKYEMRSGRTFKMTGNLIERILSTWQKYENYALRSTDEFQKGGIEAETQRGIDSLRNRGLVADDALTERAGLVAQQRTLQDKGNVASAFLALRNAGNKLYTATDNRGGSFGVGDLAVPFAVVPANVAAISGKYTPVGLLNSAVKLANVLYKASQGTLTADEQARAVTDIGRSITGIGMVAISTALALKGIIKVAGDDDKDKAALEKAEGRNGTQLNLSAWLRDLQGQDTAWRTNDMLISVGFLEAINPAMAMGSAIAEAYQDDGTITLGDIANANIEAIFQAVLDLPAMYTLSSAVDSYNYSNAKTTSGKLADAALSFAGNTGSSFVVPNFLRGIAQGTDTNVRNTYSGDTAASDVLANILSGIPGARETLPSAINGWGEERTYAENPYLRIFNANILPGTITQYQTDYINQELARLSDSGVSGIYPHRNAPSSFTVDGMKYQYTPEERDQHLRRSGNLSRSYLGSLVLSDFYKGLSDDEKADMIERVYDYANQIATREMAQGRGANYPVDTWVSNARRSENPLHYIEMYAQYGDAIYTDGYAALVRVGMTEEEAGSLYNAMSDALDGSTAISSILTAATAQNLSTDKTDAVLRAYLGESAYARYSAARDAGITPRSYANYYARLSSFGTSREGVFAAMNERAWTPEQKSAVWDTYGWQTDYETWAASH